MKKTNDTVLKLKLSSELSNTNMMKISFDKACGGGEWEEYIPNLKVTSPKVNKTVDVSVQYMNDSGEYSDCAVGEIIHENPNTPDFCEESPEACDRTPEVDSYGVVTILLTLGDRLNQELIINGTSAQVIAETAIRFASPIAEPRILVVRDTLNYGESYEDTEYIAHELLKLYESVTLIDEPAGGLTDVDVADYDLIWANNPGYPLGSSKTFETLSNFKKAVVLSGDDMSSGSNFSTTSLTGLQHIDNGVTVQCNGQSYAHDNNYGEKYRVSLNSDLLPDYPTQILNFRYGNDIDNSLAINSGVEVIGWAQGGPDSCTEKRPVIARHRKNIY